MSAIPKQVRDDVLKAIYKRLDDQQWESLGNSERTEEYARMVSDPDIGGRLGNYMDPGRIRVWIKDGPAKEYRRSLEGIGPYATLTTRTLGSPERIITAALGEGWRIGDDGISEKPMRCIAIGPSGETRYVIWGALDKLSDLVWHAVRERAERPKNTPMIVITRPSTATISPSEWGLAQRICQVVGADTTQVIQQVTRKPRDSSHTPRR